MAQQREAVRTTVAAEPDFVELPASAPSGNGAASRVGLGASARASVKATHPAPKAPTPPRVPDGRVQPQSVEEPPLSWRECVRRWVTGEQGAGYGISIVVHLFLLAILAIAGFKTLEQGPIFTTVVSEPFQDGAVGDFLNMELGAPLEAASGGGIEAFGPPDPLATQIGSIANIVRGGSGGGSGGGDGEGVGAGVAAGMRQFAPANAVRKGSFAAWTTPQFNAIYVRPFGGEDPKPGDTPRPFQPYLIEIQIQVPKGRRSYPIGDLSGSVVGTDKYVQRIPLHTFARSANGELIPLRNRSSLPVIDGFVHIVVRVPGAEALVKDTIQLRSRMLGEEQTLELVFETAPD
jgi:hypothetical protein